ncbi:MAG: FkbM family methyltransferase [Halioglobus sp.]|nr:FkbM family methyltransferase [Halioglobus sp.]
MYPELYKTVRHLLADDFFVLNIGANDGVDNDPIHPFLLMYPHWRGIFVEPITYNFEQLVRNYRRFPNVELVQAAISDQPMTMYYVDERAGCDMSLVSQCCSLDREYVERALASIRGQRPDAVTDDAEQYIVADDSVLCLTVDELLSQHAVDRIDFLNVDVEGHDFEVFRALDLTRFRPTLVCVETVDFSEPQKTYFKDRMKTLNYRFLGIFGLFSEFYVRSPEEEDRVDWHSLPTFLHPAEGDSE